MKGRLCASIDGELLSAERSSTKAKMQAAIGFGPGSPTISTSSSQQYFSGPPGGPVQSQSSSIYGNPPPSAGPSNSERASRVASFSQSQSLQQQLFGGQPSGISGGILDRPLNRTRGAEVSLNAFAFLLSEIVSYSQSRVDSVTDLERRRVEHRSPGLCYGLIT